MAAEHTTTPSPDLLRTLDESLAGLTGREFFQKLAEALAGALGARCAFVCEFTDENSYARPLVFWYEEGLLDVGSYALAGTPCERVLGGDIVVFERTVADHFPEHRAELEAVKAESYLAIPMKNRHGAIIGHVAVIDSRERSWVDADFGALRIFSSRATAELEHERAERALAAINRELELRVEDRTRELAAARDEMERRVEERTATLSAVNTRLRHEIAGRTEAEAALRRQEEAYRDLYEQAPNVYWSTGADGLIKRVNRRAAELFGVAPEELVGKPFTYLVADTPNGLPRAHKVFQRFLEGKPTFGEEFEFRGANGRTIWASVNVLPILDESGRPVATRTTLADITERKRAEEALQHRLDLEQLLTEVAADFVGARPERLTHAFEKALTRIGVWGEWDRVRLFLYAAGKAEPRLEHEWRADAIAESSSAPLVPRKQMRRRDEIMDIPDVAEMGNTALKPLLTAVGAGGLIVVPVANDSAWLGAIELVTFGRAHSWLAEDVQLLRLLGELTASTLERCAAERELEKARLGAEAASQAKSEFLARMSHELRTPLNAILGYAQLLERDDSLAASQRQQVETMRRSGEHLLTLINEVLDLARVEAGRVEIESVDTDLDALIRGVEAMFRPRAENAGLAFECRVSAECPRRIRVDDRRLRQILINLLGNAVKFTPRGGAVSLNVGAEPAQNGAWGLEFRVADTGIGIAPGHLAKIFEPFYQVERGTAEGIGLGLAITRRLVEAMDGEIAVESEPGHGTAFTIRIATSESVGGSVTSRATRPAVIGYEGKARRILVADDTRENRAVLANLLVPLGFEIIEAEDGAAAVALEETERPDLVLLDLVMPKLDGFEVIERFRGSTREQPKIVAVSANAFDDTRQRCLAAGCDAFLAKPIDLDALLELLGSLLSLEWRHASARATHAAPTSAPATTATVPLERLAELYDRARAGDVMAVAAALDDLSDDAAHATFVGEMRALTDRFDLRGVERVLQPLIESARRKEKERVST